VAARADAIVVPAKDPRVEGLPFEVLRRADPATPWNGVPLLVLRPLPGHGASYEPLDLPDGAVSTEPSPRGGLSTVEIDLGGLRKAGCVELRFQPGGGTPSRRLRVEVRTGEEGFKVVPSTVGWSCGALSRPGERRRSVVFEPQEVRALRVALDRDNRLALAGARVFAPE
jgi:hypothetical protein